MTMSYSSHPPEQGPCYDNPTCTLDTACSRKVRLVIFHHNSVELVEVLSMRKICWLERALKDMPEDT